MMEVISVEEIGLCRSGPNNDIDLQAVYGGRFSGRKEKDLKINPVYSDVSNVNQFSDINGNMSPVHVVTYETFPRSKNSTVPSENGKIQNGEAIQTTKIDWTENENNNIHEKEIKHGSGKGFIHKDRNNKNHVSETYNQKFSAGNDHFNQFNELICNTTGKASIEIVNSHDQQTENSKVIPPTTDSKERLALTETNGLNSTTDQEVQTKAYFKDYGLLGYNNGSFVLDETHIIIETKPDENENPKQTSCNEIQTECSDVKKHMETNSGKTVENLKDICENTNTESKEQTAVNSSHENPKTEIFVTSDLPESTYQEISDLCDLNTPISEGFCSSRDLCVSSGDDLPNPCESPQICPTEIVTKVLVHNSAVNETPKMFNRAKYSGSDIMCHSFDTDNIPSEMLSRTDDSDWPDIDMLARKPDEDVVYPSTDKIAQNEESKIDSQGHVRSVSDVVLHDKHWKESSDNKQGDLCNGKNSEGSSMYKKNVKTSTSCSKSCIVSEVGSSTRTLKSILSNGSSQNSCSMEYEHKRQNSDLEIHELKCVKFSEDTVFNEDKSNKYKKEKFGQINLRELYRGKIMSDSAVAKMNPLYQPDDNLEEDGTEADNDKLTYQLTLKNALRLSKGQKGNLNGPSYLEQYLILKAHGIKKDNIDIEKLPETMEKPVYDRLIQRTLAKERRKFCVKWSMVIITVAIITAIATTLGVYFKNNF